MNEHDAIICQVRESFSGLRMDMPVEKVFAASRSRRRRRLSGLTAAAAATAGAAAAVALTLGGPAPARSGSPLSASPLSASPLSASPLSASPVPVRLAAFSVTSGPGGSTTLIVRKGPQYQLDPAALRQALAQHGIPALVTVGSLCRSTPSPAGIGQLLSPLTLADGSDAMVINGRAMPPETRLSIGLFPNYTRLALIEDGAPLSCGSGSSPGQPAVHITSSGTPIR
jgi:hypothetical protein